MEKKWWHKSCVYQIYPRSFMDGNHDGIGDIKGIIEKLPYLETLGCDILWLCPMYCSPQADNGYDISDYQQIDPLFGTMEDMETLLDESKKRGIRIIMDLVVNHTSDEHRWFQEARKSEDNPYHDYYIWRKQPNELMSNFGGSAWEYEPDIDAYYLHFYSRKQPDLNWENPAMRQAIWDMMKFWIGKGISGFRMDVIDLIGKQPDQYIKENGPHLHEYLQEMYDVVLRDHDLFTVGETWGATIENASLYSNPNRHELCMIFQFEQIQLDKQPGKHRWDLKPLHLIELKQVLSKWQTALEKDGWNSLFWNNHDLPRIVSRWGNDGRYRKTSAKMLATLLHGMKGTPYIYQGEEIGMTNADFNDFEAYRDIETQNMIQERLQTGYTKEEVIQSIKAKARDHARTPMQWSDDAYAGFSTQEPWMQVNSNYIDVNVEKALQDPQSVFYYYQRLIQLRKELDVLVYGNYHLLAEDDEDIFAYERIYGDEKLLVIANFHEVTCMFTYEGIKEMNVLIQNYQDIQCYGDTLTLRPYEAIMYHIRKEKENEK